MQQGTGTVSVAPALTVPGTLTVTVTAGQSTGDVTGFVVLTRGADTRRIPFWLGVSAPQLANEAKIALARAGSYKGTTRGAPSRITSYRYPTAGDVTYPGPERVYRVRVSGRPANFGVVVLSGRVTPHVTFDASEDRLAGYTALPFDLNPYRKSFGERRPVAGVDVPAPGAYDVVFDTRSAAQVATRRMPQSRCMRKRSTARTHSTSSKRSPVSTAPISTASFTMFRTARQSRRHCRRAITARRATSRRPFPGM